MEGAEAELALGLHARHPSDPHVRAAADGVVKQGRLAYSGVALPHGYYNAHRPHRALNRGTPEEVYRARPNAVSTGIRGRHYRVIHDVVDANVKLALRYSTTRSARLIDGLECRRRGTRRRGNVRNYL